MKKALLALVLLIVVQAIVASIQAHKIYGRPVVIDNSPLLASPVAIDHFEPPNLVVTSEGDRLIVKGVVFEPWTTDSRIEDLPKFFNDSKPLRICIDPGQPSGIAFERRIHYFCGNTFFPRFFPKPLPRYKISDFGQALVGRMLAKESSEGVLPPEQETIAEQAGAGQPATRSESDLESDGKPQPESEGRSR
jgi:hypothetical protein